MNTENVECTGERYTNFSVEDFIDVTITPTDINTKFLHALLHLFSSKIHIGNVHLETPTKYAQNFNSKFGQPKIFKILEDGQLEITSKRNNAQCLDYIVKIPHIQNASQYKQISNESKALDHPSTQCIRDRINKLETFLNGLALEFKEYEKCQNVNQQVEINTNDIYNLRKHQISMADDLQDLDDKIRCMQKKIEIIEKKMLGLNKIRDIVQELEKLNEWKETVNMDLEVGNERFELLKNIKADRENLQKLNEIKANKTELLQLTTAELFSCAQNDLYVKMNMIFERIVKNEHAWMVTFNNLKDHLQCKISRDDLGVINVALNKELFVVNRKIEKLTADYTARRELHEKYIAKNNVVCKICSPLRLCKCIGDKSDPKKLKKINLEIKGIGSRLK